MTFFTDFLLTLIGSFKQNSLADEKFVWDDGSRVFGPYRDIWGPGGGGTGARVPCPFPS